MRSRSMARGLRAASLAWALSIGGFGPLPGTPAAGGERGPAELAAAIRRAVDKGSRWLAEHQNPDGGYGPYGEEGVWVANASDVGITAFCLYALARNPRKYKEADGPFISKALDFLLARQQADGAFYDPKDPSLKNYRTCVVLLALQELDPVKYAAAIRRGQEFVKSQQAAAAGGYEDGRHLGYGGVGYGDGLRPDLSNTQFAAEAMFRTGLSGSDDFWKALTVYVSRCQNSDTVDPLLEELGIRSSGDWGFRYAPNETRGPVESVDGGIVYSSYGSMTYAGLKSLLYARVGKEDPRVRKAFAWISKNFTVRENPGMATKANPKAGLNGLFYYYHTMAKALSAYGERIVVDAKGVEHDWARELAEHLLAIQKEEGHWVNASDRWFENIPALDTAYSIVSLVECAEFLSRPAEGSAK